jgi:YfiH family protein
LAASQLIRFQTAIARLDKNCRINYFFCDFGWISLPAEADFMVYEALTQVSWERPSEEGRARSAPLAGLGIAHEFGGRGVEAPPDRRHARQVHGVALVDGEALEPGVEADGVYTGTPGIVVAVKTADCVPLLLADEGRQLVVAVHAGWRGLTAGIVARAVALARGRGIAPERLAAAVGPCIRIDRFEVGREVVDALHGPRSGLTPEQAALCTVKGLADRWHVDLQAATALILLNGGLRPERIGVVQACTNADPSWHSARREGPGFGSNWAWIRL